jgi:hypothetical protein
VGSQQHEEWLEGKIRKFLIGNKGTNDDAILDITATLACSLELMGGSTGLGMVRGRKCGACGRCVGSVIADDPDDL